MKLILKPFKWLLSLIIFFLVITAILVAMLWKSIEVPVDHYSDDTITIENKVVESVDLFLEEETDRKPLSFTFNARVTNNQIRKELLTQFDYITNDNLEYVYEEGRVKVQGLWVDYQEDILNVHAGLHIDASIFTFKTALLIQFELIDTEGIIQLKMKKLNVGKIPLAWSTGLAETLVNMFTGQDISEVVKDLLGDIGELNLKDKTLTIDVRKLVKTEDDNNELIQMLIDLVYSKDLIKFGINQDAEEEYSIGLNLNINEIEDLTPALEINEPNKINNNLELESFLQQKIDMDTNKIISTLLQNKPEFRLSSLDINRVLDYFISSNMNASIDGSLETFIIYDKYSVLIKMPYLDLDDTNTTINVPIRFTSLDGSIFKTTIKLFVDINVQDVDLIFNISKVNLGNLTIEDEYIETVLSLFGSGNQMLGQGNEIILKDFAREFSQPNLKFKDLRVDSSELVLEYEIIGVINILDGLSENIEANIPQEVLDKIDEVLSNPDNEENINNLINEIENLSQEDKENIYNAIQDAFNQLT